MKYLVLMIAVVTITSCRNLGKTVKHEEQSNKKYKTEKPLMFSGEIIKLRNGGVVKVYSNSSIAVPLIAGCGVSPFQKFNYNKSKVALICSNEYFNSLYVIDLISNKAYIISQFDRRIKRYYYSFVWSGNNELFFGFEDHIRSGSAYTSKHGEVIEYNFMNHHKRNIGCSVSKGVIANIDKNRIAVNAGMGSKYVYIVKKSNCATVQRIYAKDKTGISFSPDGNYYTYFDNNGNLFINSLKNGKKILMAEGQLAPSNIRWSPDGDKLSFDEIANPKTGSKQVVIYSPATGKINRTEKPSMVSTNVFKNAFWSPDGNFLIYQSSLTHFNDEVSKGLHLYSIADHKVINTFDVSSSSTGFIRLRGWIDNHHILLTMPNSGLSIIQINKDHTFQTMKANKLPGVYSAYIYSSLN